MATYNGAQWIEQQLRSILAQADVDVHVALRDDGSEDPGYLEQCRLLDRERIEVTFAPAPSGSAAQNFFALIREHAAERFQFIAFADQDDIWDTDKLRRACEALRKDRAAGYSSGVRAVWNDGREHALKQVSTQTESDFLFEGAGQGCTFVLTADFYRRIRDFVTEHESLTRRVHFHDWTVYTLARTWGLRWTFDPAPTMTYRQHTANSLGARSFRGFQKRLQLIRSGWYREQLLAIADISAAADADHAITSRWRKLLRERQSFARRMRVARFCLRGGRRRASDNLVLALSAVLGWI